MLAEMTSIAMDVQWSMTLLSSLLRACNGRVYFSSGKRLQPLMVALLRLRKEYPIELIAHYDERGTAFAAMGSARVSGRPVLVITTSGSAVANLLPGLCEAMSQQVPLIILTADRPREEHGRGTSQTWPHGPLLAGATLRQFELPCPEDADLSLVVETAEAAISAAKHGPVHINCAFREPFHAQISKATSLAEIIYACEAEGALDATPLLAQIAAAERPLVTLGASWQPVSLNLLRAMAAAGAVIIADIISQWYLRADASTTLKKAADLSEKSAPDLWVHLGGTLLDRSILQWLRACKPRMLLVAEGEQSWDPAFCDPLRWPYNPCRYRHEVLPPATADSIWQAQWSRHCPACADDPWWQYCHEAMQWLWLSLPSDGIWFTGNSRAVRMAQALPLRPHAPKIWANRGLAGIDGNIATALGMAIAAKKPLVICIGDLTALHDQNSLGLLRYIETPVIILVLNDHGGGIFQKVISGLSEAELVEGFITPHNFQLAKLADFYGIEAHSGATPPSTAALRGHLIWELTHV